MRTGTFVTTCNFSLFLSGIRSGTLKAIPPDSASILSRQRNATRVDRKWSVFICKCGQFDHIDRQFRVA